MGGLRWPAYGLKGPSGFALGMTGCVDHKATVIPSAARDLYCSLKGPSLRSG
jgi:hypothetical protein